MSANSRVANGFQLMNVTDPNYLQAGQGIGRVFNKINKVVSGIGSVGRNVKGQVASLASNQSGKGIGQLTNKIISINDKIKNAEKRLKNMNKKQSGSGKRKGRKH